MRIPIGILKEFVSFRVGIPELVRRLTMGGFEVEEVLDVEGETVLEVNVTPNRGDCLSVLGIAREVGALFETALRLPHENKDISRIRKRNAPKASLSISIKSPRKCPRYSMVILQGVKVGPSPDWLLKRLVQFGLRPINNIVDITNYVLMVYGQPLHAFDLKKIRGKKVIVRTAAEGEKILTLDGKGHELKSDDLVIADAVGPMALAGIMGGKDSEIDETTGEVALECAFFDPPGIRKTARRLGIQTDSSYRFERRVDPHFELALSMAVQWICELAGGSEVALIDRYPKRFSEQKIPFSPDEVSSTLGRDWTPSDIKKIFRKLSFQVQKSGVRPPSWRGDLAGTPDLIEEVARIAGLEKIPVSFPVLHQPPLKEEGELGSERRIRHLLGDLGLNEVIHFSFFSPSDVEKLDVSYLEKGIFLNNPLGQEFSLMRPTLLPSLLNTTSYHHHHQMMTVRFFELRKCFQREGEGIVETKTLSGVLSGKRLFTHWSEKAQDTDFYDLKGLVERILNEVGIDDIQFLSGDSPFLHPGKQARLGRLGKQIGIFGEIHPDVQSRYGLKNPAYVFELNWEALMALSRDAGARKYFKEYSKYPIVERDLAIIINESIAAQPIEEAIRSQDPAILGVEVFDLYRGGQIPEGKKSLAFSIRMGHFDRTMTDEEVNVIYGKVIENLKKSFEMEIR